MGQINNQLHQKRQVDLAEVDFFDYVDDNPAIPPMDELAQAYPEAQALAELGLDTTDLVKIAVPIFKDKPKADIEDTVSSYIEGFDQEQTNDFWGALIGTAVNLALPHVNKLISKATNRGKPRRPIRRPVARPSRPARPATPSIPAPGTSNTIPSNIAAMLPAIIGLISNLTKKSESTLDPQTMDYLNDLSETVNEAIEFFSDRTYAQDEHIQALMSLDQSMRS